MQVWGEQLTSQVSSSGGGLPGRLDLDRDRGARYLGRIYALLAWHPKEHSAVVAVSPKLRDRSRFLILISPETDEPTPLQCLPGVPPFQLASPLVES
jgi:hypothetical protein